MECPFFPLKYQNYADDIIYKEENAQKNYFIEVPDPFNSYLFLRSLAT